MSREGGRDRSVSREKTMVSETVITLSKANTKWDCGISITIIRLQSRLSSKVIHRVARKSSLNPESRIQISLSSSHSYIQYSQILIQSSIINPESKYPYQSLITRPSIHIKILNPILMFKIKNWIIESRLTGTRGRLRQMSRNKYRSETETASWSAPGDLCFHSTL